MQEMEMAAATATVATTATTMTYTPAMATTVAPLAARQCGVSSGAGGYRGDADTELRERATSEHPGRTDLHMIFGSEIAAIFMQRARQILEVEI
jgi:hypothetical protein